MCFIVHGIEGDRGAVAAGSFSARRDSAKLALGCLRSGVTVRQLVSEQVPDQYDELACELSDGNVVPPLPQPLQPRADRGAVLGPVMSDELL